MSRDRVNGPATPAAARQRAGRPSGEVAPGRVERIRARARRADAEIDLSEEDLRALADEGIDPAEVQAVARGEHDDVREVSTFDRDTARDDLEGLRPDDEW